MSNLQIIVLYSHSINFATTRRTLARSRLDFVIMAAATNKRVVYVGGLAEEVDEKVLQVNYLLCK